MAIYRGEGGAGDAINDVTLSAITQQAANASSSASSASSSASSAATSASTAASSAASAVSAKTAAEAARDATLAAYDSFDDRYLGTKTSDPSVDNDGNALVAGSLYFNSVDGVMKLYNGTIWTAAYVSAGTYLAISNNLSDLNNAATARTNLGLGSAATTSSSAYATAAQGTKADGALQSANNLSDLTNTTTARTNLGLGSIATQAANNVSITGGSITGITDLAVADGGTGSSTASGARTNLGLVIGTDVQAYDANTAKTNVAQSFSAAQRGTVSALTDGTTITPNFAVANNFSVTLGGNRTLANPSNLTAGQSGVIVITQDGTGSRTLAFGSYWKFANGTAPTLTTTASAVDVLAYYVESSTRITARLIGDVK